MKPVIDRWPDLLHAQGGTLADFGASICIEAGMMDWAHRDPFDRLIAATARHGAVPLISTDVAFDGVVARVW